VGVAQGTLSGPWFWLAFSNKFSAPQPASTIRYADDTTCYWPVKANNSHHPVGKSVADFSHEWSMVNHMKLNAAKTKMMIIATVPEKINNQSNPTIDGHQIEYVNEMKFLGVTIDQRLNFKAHVSNIVSKATQRQFSLLKLKRNGVSTEKLKLFYISNIRSVLCYACPSFFSMLTNYECNTLESVQRLCTRFILPDLDSYTDRLTRLQLPMLEIFMGNLSQQHFSKAVSPKHCLNHRLPPKSDNARFLSSSTTRSYKVPKSRLALRERAFIPTYAKKK
jgi:hypothetical protein